MVKKGYLRLNDDQHDGIKQDVYSSFDTIPDLEIWRQFKTGNESAFIHIYKTYFKSLYNFGLQFSKDTHLVEDSIQDLFIDIRRTRKKLSDTTSIKLYLYKAIRRKILRSIKSSRKRLWDGSIEEGNNFHFTFSYEHHLISQQLNEEKIERLNRALQTLPKRQREVIYYFFYEQMGYLEIKEIMDFANIKSVRNKAYIALKTLRKSCE
ncbi:sigma-70 family RNA polymerase sigma factor [Aquimarina sp. U1-2]|uniref:RNA polymerase sigma factor n=1 Tax=Aquimarina sp. U1-2 TaxID=2823141 RepID=UPI001AED0169|nr:sigma-70 family RNA polymerase sigma factor [Aquimarina sp. U1-2]MBP2830680.1 sigma-70 family RNA polymerase sigma factor [Aquimarina sp. U1-2]